MTEEYRGYTFSTREERGLPPLTQKDIDEAKRQFAEFDARRAAVRPEDRVYIGEGDRFGGWDGWDGEEEARREGGEHE